MGFFEYVIGLGAAVMMPVIFTILGTCIGIKFSKALKSGLLVGVGFVGLGVVTALLTGNLGPALGEMMRIFELKLDAFDMGWPAAASVAYNTLVGAFIIPVCFGVNLGMFACGVTRTVNIDLWNYWHYAFIGSVVYFVTGKLGWSAPVAWGYFAAVVCFIVTIVMADLTADGFQKFYPKMEGISIPQPFCQSFTPFAVVVNWVLDRIPGFNRIKIDAEGMKNRFGLFGEPLFLGVAIGVLIGFLATPTFDRVKVAWAASGFGAVTLAHAKAFGSGLVGDLPKILKLGITIGAVMELIPRITALFIEGLKPIADSTRERLASRFSGMKLNIGMSPALVIGHPATLVVSILLIPVTIVLAVVLPGNKFLPLASLAGMFYLFPCVLPITKGNVVKTFVVGLVAMTVGLYFATDLAPHFTLAAADVFAKTGDAAVKIPSDFSSGAALDFASALLCWTIFHATVTLKWIGAGLLALLSLALMIYNGRRIARQSRG